MTINRVWAMPSADTFDIPAIRQVVRRLIAESSVSVDPFARNKDWATYTNDLNPQTRAQSHVDAVDFLESLADGGIKADLLWRLAARVGRFCDFQARPDCGFA